MLDVAEQGGLTTILGLDAAVYRNDGTGVAVCSLG